MIVVGAQPRDPWAGRLVDLRVDRSDAPLAQLRQLLDASRAYDGFHDAAGALSAGDAAAALASAEEGLRVLPGEENLRFVRAGALAVAGRQDLALAELRSLVATRPSWEVVVRGFADKGLIELPAPGPLP